MSGNVFEYTEPSPQSHEVTKHTKAIRFFVLLRVFASLW